MNNPRLTTIRLYGEMGRKFGRVHRAQLEANTTAEAVRYLRSQFPEASAYLMTAKDRGIGFAVFRGKENIGEKQLNEPVGNDDIRIAPIILGSKNGGILQIIVGIVLVVVGTYTTVFSAGTSSTLVALGWGMIFGGVVQMLTPVPKGTKNKSVENEPSYAFNGAVNTQAQGNPVPLLYGRMIVGSAVISAGINAESYAPKSNGIGTGFDNSPGGGPWNPKNPYIEFNPA